MSWRAMIVACALCLPTSASAEQVCASFAQTSVGVVQTADITEASGLAHSYQHADVLWTHNDSGDSPRIFAISTSGELLATLTLQGIDAIDWEDIAVAPCTRGGDEECIYLADIGNNTEARDDLRIIQVREPEFLDEGTLTAEAMRVYPVVYPEGDAPRIPDAEAFMVARDTLEMVIATKEPQRSRLFAIADFEAEPEPLALVGELPRRLVTGGDFHPDMSRVAVREYSRFYEYALERTDEGVQVVGEPFTRRVIGRELQGEAIAYAASGADVYTLAEGEQRDLFVFSCEPVMMDEPDAPEDMPEERQEGVDMPRDMREDMRRPEAMDTLEDTPNLVNQPKSGCSTTPARPSPCGVLLWSCALAGLIRRRPPQHTDHVNA